MAYVYLLIAVVAEVFATSALKLSDGFTKLWPSVVVVIGYSAAFYSLSLSLRTLSLSTAYASWCGLGIVLVALVQVFWFRNGIDLAGFVGLGLIIAGVLVVNLLSKSVAH